MRNSDRLVLQATCSTFTSDWALRLRATANINLFLIRETPLPRLARNARPFLGHNAVRGLIATTTATHHSGVSNSAIPGVSQISRRSLGRCSLVTRIAGSSGGDRRCGGGRLRPLRDQYAHVLSTFRHTSYPKAPDCAWHVRRAEGHRSRCFHQEHDPYWDIQLNENLPQPVIDLPVVEAEPSTVGDPALGRSSGFPTNRPDNERNVSDESRRSGKYNQCENRSFA